MPKKINDTIGKCDCSQKKCTQVADVRKMKNGKLYLVCPVCGVIRPGGDSFQEYILLHARMNGPDGEPAPAPEKPDYMHGDDPADWTGPGEHNPSDKAPPRVAAETSKGAGNQPGPVSETKPEPVPKKSGLIGWLNDFNI